MRIAIIADPLDNQRAGVHVYLRELVNALAKNPGPHEYILIREQVDEQLPLRQIALPNIHLPIGYASLRLFFIIPYMLRKLKVDAVYEPAHFGPFNLPGRVKRVTMIHDLTPILLPEYHRWHSQLLQQLFLKGILRRTDIVIANSQNTANDLAKVYPFTADKTETILLAANRRFQPDDRLDFLQTYKIEQPYFLFVGTIEPRKNLSLLLDAYEQFRSVSDQHIMLVIVGAKGWKTDAFFEKLNQHSYKSDILLTGFIDKDHLPQAYHHALALVYPSIYEGFGFPVLEALACGTNVICPDNSSLPEVGGGVAYYYPTHDATALKDQLKIVATQDKEVLDRRKKGPEWAANFSWTAYAEAFNRIFI